MTPAAGLRITSGTELGKGMPRERKNRGSRRNPFPSAAGRLSRRAPWDGTVAAMCGRFTLTTRRDLIAAAFALEEVPELAPRWNAAPGQDVATIAQTREGPRRLRLRRWGLVPGWARDGRMGSRLINARAETATVRPAFREAMRLRRCIVPADGFYEWAGGGPGSGRRRPYYIALPDRAPFAIAGVYERWRGEDGAWLETCALLTVAANERVRALHDRMP